MSIRWGYALNQWKRAFDQFTLPEQHARALKTIAVSGFSGVELLGGTGRWYPLGCLSSLRARYGSVEDFAELLRSTGLSGVPSLFFDPAMPLQGTSYFGGSPVNPASHEAIADVAADFIDLLAALGGETLVVRALPPAARMGELTRDKLATAARCWNLLAERAMRSGIRVALHADFLSPLRTVEQIGEFLALTEREAVGLAIDTAEMTVAGIDPVTLYRAHWDRTMLFHFKDARDTDSLGEYARPGADIALFESGGSRGIDRWFWEMGQPEALVDFAGLLSAMHQHGYDGWVIVESDQSPHPATSTLLNGWYVKHVLHPMLGSGQ